LRLSDPLASPWRTPHEQGAWRAGFASWEEFCATKFKDSSEAEISELLDEARITRAAWQAAGHSSWVVYSLSQMEEADRMKRL
jgi:hypothetical protein